MKMIFFFWVVVLVGACSSGSTGDDNLLREAAARHNEAMKIAAQARADLATVVGANHAIRDSVAVLGAALEAWEGDVVEVPGNAEHDHEGGDHHHHHNHGEGAQPELTAYEMLAVQEDLKARIAGIHARIRALK